MLSSPGFFVTALQIKHEIIRASSQKEYGINLNRTQGRQAHRILCRNFLAIVTEESPNFAVKNDERVIFLKKLMIANKKRALAPNHNPLVYLSP